MQQLLPGAGSHVAKKVFNVAVDNYVFKGQMLDILQKSANRMFSSEFVKELQKRDFSTDTNDQRIEKFLYLWYSIRICEYLLKQSGLYQPDTLLEKYSIQALLCFWNEAVNEVRLIGRAGSEAKMGGTEKHPVVYFSLATHNNYKSSDTGELTQKTDWHRIVIFKPNLRESVYNFLQKGQRVYVNGRLSYGEITDASGQTKPTSAVIADDVIFFQSKM